MTDWRDECFPAAVRVSKRNLQKAVDEAEAVFDALDIINDAEARIQWDTEPDMQALQKLRRARRMISCNVIGLVRWLQFEVNCAPEEG